LGRRNRNRPEQRSDRDAPQQFDEGTCSGVCCAVSSARWRHGCCCYGRRRDRLCVEGPLPAGPMAVGSAMTVGSGSGSRPGAGNVDDLDGRGTDNGRVVPTPVPIDGDKRASAEPKARSCNYRDHQCPSHRRISYMQRSFDICSIEVRQ